MLVLHLIAPSANVQYQCSFGDCQVNRVIVELDNCTWTYMLDGEDGGHRFDLSLPCDKSLLIDQILLRRQSRYKSS